MKAVIRNVVVVMLFVIPVGVFAQNTRSAVSVTGSDAATCTVPDPCRTFGAALSKTNSGGEVIVLSSGGYGPFTVSQAVTIVSPPGIYAAIAPASGIGISISTASGATVVLRGLYVNGAGAPYGIYVFSAGANIYLENMVVAGLNCSGCTAVIMPQDGNLRVTDSFFRNDFYGVSVAGTSATVRARATIDHCRLLGTTVAVQPSNFSTVTLTNSLLTGNFRGISIDSPSADIDAHVTVDNSVFTQNSVGIFAIRTAALVYVSSSVITQNTQFGLDIQQGAQVLSAGNNVLIDNAAGEAFTNTFALK
ncbi:MAG: hypothetical protein DMF58_11655 [Acidobacteria bacterium]|nr:MAG: hypothetical protein DMF58_11655 [Acidobacteriota bacterium]